MAVNALLDTGAILALLDKTDRWHQPCVDAFQHLRLPLITSEAVLMNCFILLATTAGKPRLRGNSCAQGPLMTIADSELPGIQALMSRYWDRPMDFADATLVYLAKRESLATIFTVDHSDFETYRIEGQRRFRVLPAKKKA